MNRDKIKRREFLRNLTLAGAGTGILGVLPVPAAGKDHGVPGTLPAPAAGKGGGVPGTSASPGTGASWQNELKIGIVGLSVHSAAFSRLINDPGKAADLKGCRIAALYHPPGSPDVDFSAEQLAGFEQEVRKMQVKIVGSMSELLDRSDVIMIETNDGRPHLEQVMPAFEAGKPVFIDKPISADLRGVVNILEKAKEHQVPVFSSSALRYLESAQQVDKSAVLGAFTYSPAPTEKSHTDLFWYGIHGVELLYTVMGEGCREVMHVHHTGGEDLVIGFWEGGRAGTFRGIRDGRRDYGGTVFGKKANHALGTFEGYRPLVVKVVEFFLTRKPPVPLTETLEIYAFMEAAQESRERGGTRVSLEEVLKRSR